MLALSLNMSAQQSYEINLWPNGPAVKSSDAGDTAKVKVFLPERIRHGTCRGDMSGRRLSASRHGS